MKSKSKILKIESDSVTAELLANQVLKNPDIIPQLLSEISSPKSKVRFKSIKALKIVSEKASEKPKSR